MIAEHAGELVNTTAGGSLLVLAIILPVIAILVLMALGGHWLSRVVPVLLLFGGEDTETPPQRALELAAVRAGRPTRTVVLAATGHLTASERPAEVGVLLRTLTALR